MQNGWKRSIALGLCSLTMGLLIAAVFFIKGKGVTRESTVADRSGQLSQETLGSDVPILTERELADRWIVNAIEAKQLIQQGATLLDARPASVRRGTLQSAIAVDWRQFSQAEFPNRGKLLENPETLTTSLRSIGVSNHVPVVVIGDPKNGWGEEGRIVWMLRTLGHSQAVFVDGGYAALVNAEVPKTRSIAQTSPQPGDFSIQHQPDWETDREALKTNLRTQQAIVVDVREAREFAGQTPYGEVRRGHVPGAIHLYYKDLLDADGKLLPREAILAKLQSNGIDLDSPIVSYCTGGVRSGWFTAVLVSLGFPAKNYAGSMWEWSASAAEAYPLVISNRKTHPAD